MNHIQLGQLVSGKLRLDSSKLIDTRLLVQANSGGGKSYLLRLLAEQAAGQLQTIILDSEGEFATLREKHDLLLIGKEGEIPTDVRAAALMARKLCELRVSTVIDLYDLTLSERRKFVRLFLESLMSVPRGQWHPMLIIIDEAQVYCPERSAGEAESANAVIALMCQGRKRGFAGLLATQRLSKLHKDAAAECNNVVVGRTWLDVDQARAGDLLGMQKPARQGLRDLPPGQFFAFGPALSASGVVRFTADKAETTHPQAGMRHSVIAPEPSVAIRQLVEQLKDLPQQADDEARTLADAQKEIVRLKREIAGQPRVAALDAKTIETTIASREQELVTVFRRKETELLQRVCQLEGKLSQIHQASAPDGLAIVPASLPERQALAQMSAGQLVKHPPISSSSSPGQPMSAGQRKILTALAQYPEGRSKTQIAILTEYAHNGGGFNNYLSALRTNGWIENGDPIHITPAGLAALGTYEPLPTGTALLKHWLTKLAKAEREILQALYDAYPQSLTKEQVAAATPTKYEPSGGGFNNALSKLRTLELISGRGELTASASFFS